jgi:hypothetical protein
MITSYLASSFLAGDTGNLTNCTGGLSNAYIFPLCHSGTWVFLCGESGSGRTVKKAPWRSSVRSRGSEA